MVAGAKLQAETADIPQKNRLFSVFHTCWSSGELRQDASALSKTPLKTTTSWGKRSQLPFN
jgi:hypothetical protein